ncbi:immunoglobulin-like domain-containing protein [Flavobacterium notoginsengisoli]|uniref:immunoglobulin-like domain-containing protein n=1 Tax=Flavobacterium notoginsengisoli TaxID=1478199 RepID=UPI00363A26A3
MKNIFIKLMTVVVSGLLLTSCDADSSAGVSKVTNYPVFEVNGETTLFVAQGATYNDPGVVATENGAEIPVEVSFAGKYRGAKTLDTSKIDQYTQTYSATNVDGFKGSTTRKVIVYKTGDLVTSIEGVYIATTRRNGTLMAASQGSSVDVKYIYIWKNADGSYEVSDAFGGWYDISRNIGVTSAAVGGTITGNIATNTFTFPGIPVCAYFGGSAKISGLTVDPATKTLVLTTDWAADAATNYKFVSTLTQVQL